jgi:branched-chain amino acid transport system permease protein
VKNRQRRMAFVYIIVYCLGAVLLFGIPIIIKDPYVMHIIIISMINACLALSLNLMIMTGHVSLAHAAFVGIGAYTSTLLVMRLNMTFWFALPIAGLMGGMVGFLLGLLTLKLKGVYFALATFAFNEILRQIFIGWVSLFGGATGIIDVPSPAPIIIPGLVTLQFTTKFTYFYIIAVFFMLTLFVLIRLHRSQSGLIFKAIAGGELLTEILGINTMKFKISAFVISSFIAGITGSIYAHYFHYIGPQDFSFWESVNVLVFVVVGGTGTIVGPVLGSTLLTITPEFLRFAIEYQTLLYGLVLILVLLFMPRGIYGLLGTIIEDIPFNGKVKKNVDFEN